MPLRKILLPVDGSKHSMNAAEYTVELAKAFGSKVVLLTVFKSQTIVVDDPYFQKSVEALSEKAKHRQARYKELLTKHNIPHSAFILDGPVAEAIADAAKREHADMIIMGSKGRTNLEGLLFGSKTHKLLHIAPCPLLVIRLRHKWGDEIRTDSAK